MKNTPLTIVQGEPFRYLVRIKQLNDEGTSEPYPLTGCRVHLQARTRVDAPDTLVDLSSDDGGITIDEEAGTFLLYMPSSKTSALQFPRTSAARPVYQCEVTFADGDGFRALSGTMTLDPEVVR